MPAAFGLLHASESQSVHDGRNDSATLHVHLHHRTTAKEFVTKLVALSVEHLHIASCDASLQLQLPFTIDGQDERPHHVIGVAPGIGSEWQWQGLRASRPTFPIGANPRTLLVDTIPKSLQRIG